MQEQKSERWERSRLVKSGKKRNSKGEIIDAPKPYRKGE